MKKSKLVLSAIFLTSCTMAHATQYNDEVLQNEQYQNQGQSQQQRNVQDNMQETYVTNTSNSDVVTNVNTARIPVSSAIAPSVYSANECMGSSSGGVQSVAFGLSLGSTWKDKDCQLFKAAYEFERAGLNNDALFIRCKSDLVKDSPSCKAIAK